MAIDKDTNSLKSRIKAQYMTAREFAAHIKMNESTLSRVLNETKGYVTPKALKKINEGLLELESEPTEYEVLVERMKNLKIKMDEIEKKFKHN